MAARSLVPSLHDLYEARFRGLYEAQIRNVLDFDESHLVQDSVNYGGHETGVKERHARLSKALAEMGVHPNHLNLFCAYYAQYNRTLGKHECYESWVLLATVSDKRAFRHACFRLQRKHLLDDRKFEQADFQSIQKDCLISIKRDGAYSRLLSTAFEASRSLNDDETLAMLRRTVIASGDPKLVNKLLSDSRVALSEHELATIGRRCIARVSEGHILTEADSEFFAKHRELNLAGALMKAVLENSASSWLNGSYLAGLAREVAHKLTTSELRMIYSRLRFDKDPANAKHKLAVLNLLVEYDKGMVDEQTKVLKQTFEYELLNGSFEKACMLANRMNYKLRAFDVYRRSLEEPFAKASENKVYRQELTERLAVMLSTSNALKRPLRPEQIDASLIF